ncbi:outer membrane lipoprotein-sorting protein [Thalassospira sp. MCCC 1A01428]|uniref:outer membrane lipoprotein-sorting protein n=1 Tax=Thalassospira sp. MCCC 1A01428 TaxID=1470575 RepID=UPI000A1DDDC4|nr:outer membrane lipoprotein-sorting protein [Thalassospira sp. MCCC 1A01428]
MNFSQSRRWAAPLLAFALLFIAINNANADEMTGRQILDEVSSRHDRPYETENQTMTLIDNRGNTEERTLRRYAREWDNGLYRYLLVFDQPAGVRGVALLTWQNRGASDDQWIHLPAYGREMKRSADGGKRNYFMGTDFAFEDMTSEDRDKFKYERQPDETAELKNQDGTVVDTIDSYVVDAYPKDKELAAETGYKYRRLYISKDRFYIRRIDFYDRRGRFLKNQYAWDMEQIEGDTWRANTVLMDNAREKHQTLVHIQNRDLSENAVPERMFEQRWVTSGRHLRQ